MAYALNRSMNADLQEGMTDGKYKKVIPNRGGITQKALAYAVREDLNDIFYGIHEAPVKRLPDVTVDRSSENYVPTKPAQIGV